MSTRRARIKAVTALPPRRKNADSAADKKKQEDLKEGFESGVKLLSVRRPSTNDKTPKAKRVSTDTEHSKEELAVRVSPLKRRLSLDKTQGQRRFSIDKAGQSTKDGYENDVKTLKSRRFSLDKTPKRRLSIDKTPVKHSSAINTDQLLPAEITIQHTPALVKDNDSVTNIPEKSVEVTPSNKLSIGGWFPNTKILQNLLNGSEKSPKTFPLRSPVPETTDFTGKGKVQFNCNPSTSKNNSSESNMPDLIPLDTKKVPFFASPQGRASPRRPPIVRTPVIAVDLIEEKLIAPHKGPNSMSGQNYIEIHAAEVTPKDSKPEDEIIIEKNNKTGINELKNALAPKKSKCSIQIINEYVIKPVPEASTVMDGIVPLQSATKAPKPIDLLKNEIISENAEVLFDPIVPLPSPSKVRPKLRPVPRLGPRRNSFQQGSASESEDENRRILGRPVTPATPVPSRQRNDSHTLHAVPIVQRDVARVRNDSVCSNISQSTSHAAVSSPLRERDKSLKTRREEMTARRNAAMRRRHVEVEREKLTMYDFIFYNPKDNPIIPDQDEIKAKEANKKEEEERKAEASQAGSKAEATSESAPAAVPQIKLGPNGEIILDEQSLVVNQSDQRKLDSTVVREGAWGGSGSRAYRRTPRTADWSDAETVRFYRALAAMGTDFTLMQPLFPARSRRDLKLKFKKEERVNLSQIDMALRSGAEWDPDRLQTEFAEERKAAEEAAKKAAERLKREKEAEKERERDMKLLRVRRSKCSKILGDSGMPQTFNHSKTAPATLDEYVKFQQERSKKPRRTRKQKQDLDVTLQSVTLTPVPPIRTPSPSLATLTLVDRNSKLRQIASKKQTPKNDMATLTKEVSSPSVPTNIETGSLVVLTVNDPQSPSRKMLQTYIAQGPGNLTPVSLPANFLNSVVGFMKKSNSPKPTVMGSPGTSISKTPNIISPRKRTSSYNITQL